jgi:uncharacterized protein YdaU (DUF1376 family)
MPLYVGDYLGDTGHLTTTQHGAYLLLMMHYWRKGSLPDDDKQLSKITKLPLKVWTEYRETLQEFFHDGWHHKRIDAELYKTESIKQKRANAGHLGGIRSAMSRMKLEDAALSKRAPIQANAYQVPSKATARLDYPQSQSNSSNSDGAVVEGQQDCRGAQGSKPGINATPQLLATPILRKFQ